MTQVTETLATSATSAQARVVRVRYFAGARAAAGVAEEDVRLDGAATVATVLAAVRGTHGPELDRVLGGCSFLLNGVAVHDHETPLPEADKWAEIDILPPFAGG
jgi:sulfur-carrier protein